MRRATRADAEAVRNVAVEGWRATYSGLLRHSTIEAFLAGPYDLENVRRRINQDEFFIAIDDGQIVAYVDAVPEAERVFLAAIYALPDRRRQGAGTALLNTIVERLPDLPIDAFVLLHSAKGEGFYERRGFAPGDVVEQDLFGERVSERRWRREALVEPVPDTETWQEWQQPYRYGALVVVPSPEVASAIDAVRTRFDPRSAAIFGAHITLTPPFAHSISTADRAALTDAVHRSAAFQVVVGAATRFPGTDVVYLPVEPLDGLARVRRDLLNTGLFRTDLDRMDGYIPHLTLSEFGADPDAAIEAGSRGPLRGATFVVDSVSWIAPDASFRFRIRDTYSLERS